MSIVSAAGEAVDADELLLWYIALFDGDFMMSGRVSASTNRTEGVWAITACIDMPPSTTFMALRCRWFRIPWLHAADCTIDNDGFIN